MGVKKWTVSISGLIAWGGRYRGSDRCHICVSFGCYTSTSISCKYKQFINQSKREASLRKRSPCRPCLMVAPIDSYKYKSQTLVSLKWGFLVPLSNDYVIWGWVVYSAANLTKLTQFGSFGSSDGPPTNAINSLAVGLTCKQFTFRLTLTVDLCSNIPLVILHRISLPSSPPDKRPSLSFCLKVILPLVLESRTLLLYSMNDHLMNQSHTLSQLLVSVSCSKPCSSGLAQTEFPHFLIRYTQTDRPQ